MRSDNLGGSFFHWDGPGSRTQPGKEPFALLLRDEPFRLHLLKPS